MRRPFNVRAFCWVLLLLTGTITSYVLSQPRLYESFGRVAVLQEIDLEEMVADIKSPEFSRQVAQRIMRDGDTLWIDGSKSGEPLSEAALLETLMRDHVVKLNRDTRIINVGFRHTDREVAARVAGCITDELIAMGARRRIDESVKQVEMLKIAWSETATEVKRLEQETAENVAVSMESSDASDVRRLREHTLNAAQKELDGIVKKLRETTMITGLYQPSYRLLEKPHPAAEDAYLRGPIIKGLAWGWAVAAVSATAMGFIFKRSGKSRRVPFTLLGATLVRPFNRGEWIVVFAVVAAGVICSILYALSQPRIYQARITVTVADKAKNYGWDYLSADDFKEWLPVITQRVIIHFTHRRYGRTLLGYQDHQMIPDSAEVEEMILRNLRAAVYADTNTLELSYRNADFRIAGEVLEEFMLAYMRYPKERERENPELARQRLLKRKQGLPGGMEPNPLEVDAGQRWPATNDYLVAPIIGWIGIGCLISVGCSAAVVFGLRLSACFSIGSGRHAGRASREHLTNP
jgi:hypothetical protein